MKPRGHRRRCNGGGEFEWPDDMLKQLAISPWLVLLACRAPAPAPLTDDDAPSIVIRGARIFDGERMIGVRTVLIRDGLILGLSRDRSFPDKVDVIEGAECTLLPGLIDAHCHVT